MNSSIEKHELARSSLAQKPTQRDLAELIGESKTDMLLLATASYKEQFIERRPKKVKDKVRNLVYPVGRLRRVHEKLKFHLKKIKQPSYLLSPRCGLGTRDNALVHLDQDEYLSLDLRQFYPSTTEEMVKNWYINELGMFKDVARVLIALTIFDGRVPFGSPLTPVLVSLVHRKMFDDIAALCDEQNLRYSVWVDDLTISGSFVPRAIMGQIRKIVRGAGLTTHKVKFLHGNRPVFITGIGVVGTKLIVPNRYNLRLKDAWNNYHSAITDDEVDSCTDRLLSQMGAIRYIVGRSSATGQKMSDQMNSLRQQRSKRLREQLRESDALVERHRATVPTGEAPW
jgi:RNA-directed DNA polymerase